MWPSLIIVKCMLHMWCMQAPASPALARGKGKGWMVTAGGEESSATGLREE